MIGKFLTGLAIVTLPILLWDSQRWTVAPSPWDWSIHNYGGIYLAHPSTWLDRTLRWGDLLWYLTASWPVWIALVALFLIHKHRKQENSPYHSQLSTLNFQLLLAWSLGFIALHLLTTIQIWDRYLLPLAPMVALLAGWIGKWDSQTVKQFRAIHPRLIQLALLVLLLPSALAAAQGNFPLGADHGAYAGLDVALARLNREASEPLVLYHRQLGWHYQFYLYERIQAGTVDLRWQPSSVYLANNALSVPHRRKFLIQPDWVPVRELAFHLQVVGLRLITHLHNGQMTLYEIIQVPGKRCDWCWSGRRSALHPFPTLTNLRDKAMICPR